MSLTPVSPVYRKGSGMLTSSHLNMNWGRVGLGMGKRKLFKT